MAADTLAVVWFAAEYRQATAAQQARIQARMAAALAAGRGFGTLDHETVAAIAARIGGSDEPA